MQWALVTFTHYTGDDAQYDNFEPADYTWLEAPSLHAALQDVARVAGHPLARLDDGDSPYGGTFAHARLARRYFKLNDFARSNTLVYGLFAASVLAMEPPAAQVS